MYMWLNKKINKLAYMLCEGQGVKFNVMIYLFDDVCDQENLFFIKASS